MNESELDNLDTNMMRSNRESYFAAKKKMTVWFRSLQNIQKRKKILKTLDARSKKPRGGC